MGDVLGAASLFLAVLGLLYGAWYREIVAAESMHIEPYRANRDPDIEQVKAAYESRSLPLAVGSVALALILAPSFVETLVRAVRAIAGSGLGAIHSYDVVGTLFCAVYVATVMLAIHTVHMTVRVHRRLDKLEAPDVASNDAERSSPISTGHARGAANRRREL